MAFAVDSAVATKLRNYVERCEAEGLVYIPLAIDTFGGWHPQALQVISRLALQLARATDGERGVVKRHLHQRLAVHFMRDNVAMLGACIPSFTPQEPEGDANSG